MERWFEGWRFSVLNLFICSLMRPGRVLLELLSKAHKLKADYVLSLKAQAGAKDDFDEEHEVEYEYEYE